MDALKRWHDVNIRLEDSGFTQSSLKLYPEEHRTSVVVNVNPSFLFIYFFNLYFEQLDILNSFEILGYLPLLLLSALTLILFSEI